MKALCLLPEVSGPVGVATSKPSLWPVFSEATKLGMNTWDTSDVLSWCRWILPTQPGVKYIICLFFCLYFSSFVGDDQVLYSNEIPFLNWIYFLSHRRIVFWWGFPLALPPSPPSPTATTLTSILMWLQLRGGPSSRHFHFLKHIFIETLPDVSNVTVSTHWHNDLLGWETLLADIVGSFIHSWPIFPFLVESKSTTVFFPPPPAFCSIFSWLCSDLFIRWCFHDTLQW